ncbi:MAG: M20/M25/M40 family metallo-hydrolase [Anaerolineae bacterium]|nr:M20/M25/M40 family metallo-hydrolase [Anaerolineae bacterium]
MSFDLEKHLIDLSNAPGISGYEGPVRALIRECWEGLADEFRVDDLGTLVATVHGSGPEPRPRVLITAHMDEIGLLVSGIEDGFLRVSAVGGIDTRVLLSQPVTVHGERSLPGLIGSRPPHVIPQSERNKYPALEDLVVDLGLPARQVAKLVTIGTPVTFDQQAVALNGGLVTGKALDNRVSVAAMTQLLRNLRARRHEWDVLVAATVQEEVGLKGGRTIAFRLQPDIALVVDATFGTGPSVSEEAGGFKLDGGPVVAIGPNIHQRLFDRVIEAGKDLDMGLPLEPLPGNTGTEAWAIQISQEGIPTALVSIPVRNMHTPVEVVSVADIRRTARLLAELITRLDGETLRRLSLDEPGPEKAG